MTAAFPPGMKWLPAPSPVLSSLLEEIDSLAELKCTLRFLWYAAQTPGFPKTVAVGRAGVGLHPAARARLERCGAPRPR